MKEKGFSQILIILGAVLLLGFFFFVKNYSWIKDNLFTKYYTGDIPSPENGPTYINQYFSLSYSPSEWKFKENNLGRVMVSSVTFTDTNNNKINIDVADFSKGVGDIGAGGLPFRTKDITIDGVSVKELFSVKDSAGVVQMVAVFKKGNLYYGISVNNKDDDFTQIDKILSTFKFAGIANAVNTSNWKTYSNTAFNYTIKYPENWEVGGPGSFNPSTTPGIDLNSPCNYQQGDQCFQVGISVGTPDPTKDKLDPNFLINLNSTNPDIVSNKTTMKIDGEQASGFDYYQSNYGSPPEGRLQYVVVTNHNGNKYTFAYEESQKGKSFKTSSDWTTKRLFDQILSTFKFTNQNQPMTNNSQNYLYLARNNVFLHNTENVGQEGSEKSGGTPVDIVIPLPSTSTVQTAVSQTRQQNSSVIINGSTFLINVFGNPNEGGCKLSASCTATDSTLDVNNIHIEYLRIWKDTNRVIDINPQSVVVNNYSIPYFTIQKSSPNTFFTNDEVIMWRDLLSKMQTIPPTN